MRVLIISDAEREAAHKLAEFAARPENHYKPGPGAKVPGDDPRFVVHFGMAKDFRCVFTFTALDGLWRHLSISVPSLTMFPHPVMVEEIAHLFGFKGGYMDWRVGTDKPNRAIILAQKVG